MTKALLVIDVQKDYFPDGAFPLWNADAVLNRIEAAMGAARESGMPVILVQHVVDPSQGPAPFFNGGTEGVEIHPRILAAAPGAPIVIKHYADSFEKTNLKSTLATLGVDELLVCGMMTQNCVTHTLLSRAADQYKVVVLEDGCTTVSEILHLLALHALSTRLPSLPWSQAIPGSAGA